MNEQFAWLPELLKEIKTLKDTVKTQQEAVNAAAVIIDELRKENKLLKKGLYLREVNNELARLKQEVIRSTEAYIKLSERHDQLMSIYIKL
jgi:hypothetical protein